MRKYFCRLSFCRTVLAVLFTITGLLITNSSTQESARNSTAKAVQRGAEASAVASLPENPAPQFQPVYEFPKHDHKHWVSRHPVYFMLILGGASAGGVAIGYHYLHQSCPSMINGYPYNGTPYNGKCPGKNYDPGP